MNSDGRLSQLGNISRSTALQECPKAVFGSKALAEGLYRDRRPWHSSPVVRQEKEAIKIRRQGLQECPYDPACHLLHDEIHIDRYNYRSEHSSSCPLRTFVSVCMLSDRIRACYLYGIFLWHSVVLCFDIFLQPSASLSDSPMPACKASSVWTWIRYTADDSGIPAIIRMTHGLENQAGKQRTSAAQAALLVGRTCFDCS